MKITTRTERRFESGPLTVICQPGASILLWKQYDNHIGEALRFTSTTELQQLIDFLVAVKAEIQP